MIIEIDGGAVINSESLDNQNVRDTEITIPDDESVDIRSDGSVAITIQHDGVDERIIDDD